ncbi:MAG: Uma2 family endonuclease [Cyanobacteria bacterium P01_G01_bin.38]
MIATPTSLKIAWKKLPDDFKLPDGPVDNITQPLLANALRESLELAGKLPGQSLTTTNYGICATVNDKIVVKAPDWAFIPNIQVSRESVERSYTPKLQGEFPTIVMEFLSETEGGEYSTKPTYPPGKWFFYERVLKVPNYAIFDPSSGALELYQLDDTGRYELAAPTSDGRYWIASLELYLGIWSGTRYQRTGYWLRWWTTDGGLLLWGDERVEQERQRAEQERQRAEQAESVQAAAIAKLLDLGLSVEQVAESLGVSAEALKSQQT